MVFSGELKTKEKEKLGDVASMLSLSVNGTNKLLVDQIQTYLNTNPSLVNNPQFTGLFANCAQDCKCPTNSLRTWLLPGGNAQAART